MADDDNLPARDRAMRYGRKIQTLRRELAALTASRDLAILELSDAGMKRRDVAALAEVTQGRVQQIIEAARTFEGYRARLARIVEESDIEAY